jgi:hypothetical protein
MPQKRSAKSRQQERDYSHRSLLDKLGVKPSQRVCVLGVSDMAFQSGLEAVVPDFCRDKLAKEADLIFLAANDLESLARIKSLVGSIKRDGAIWIVYPKGQKHIRETDVMAAGKSAGFTDNKVCRFSETHTALRFVVPLARR